MPLSFNKSTDSSHEVKLDSRLISATWKRGGAMAGGKVGFKIQTALVGLLAPITVKGKSEKGLDLGKVTGKVMRNQFQGFINIPEDVELGDRVYFEVELPDNGIDGVSEYIPVVPIVSVSSLRWDVESARRGDIVKLTASTRNLNDYAEVMVSIFEYDEDRGSERVIDIPGIVKKNRLEVMWEFGYFEDTGQIAGQPELTDYEAGEYKYPEYYFTVSYEDLTIGEERESGMLVFNDWQAITLANEDDTPAANERYFLHLANGEQREGRTDQDGYALEEFLPPGPTRIEFPDI